MIIFQSPKGNFAISGKHVALLMPVHEPTMPEMKTRIVLDAIGDGGRSISMTVEKDVQEIADLVAADISREKGV